MHNLALCMKLAGITRRDLENCGLCPMRSSQGTTSDDSKTSVVSQGEGRHKKEDAKAEKGSS